MPADRRCPAADEDVVSYYSAFYRAGMTDLSSAAAAPRHHLPAPRPVPAEDLGFVPPTGCADLRERIAARYQAATADNVLLCAGASEALAAVALALLSRGQAAAACGAPYPSFVAAAEAVGARIGGMEILDSAKLVLLTNPTQPPGRWADIAGLADQANRSGAVLVADEVYRELALFERPATAATDLDPGAVSIGDLSKPLGYAGLRIGWLVTRDDRLRAILDRQLQLLSGGPSSLSALAAVAAFECFDANVARTVAAAVRGLGVLEPVLSAAGWTHAAPDAGVAMPAWPPSLPRAAFEAKVRAAGYFLLPNRVFDRHDSSYRVSLLADPAALRQALALLD